MVIALLIIGVLLLVFPSVPVRVAHLMRPEFPAERSGRTIGAARVAGALIIVAALLLALAEG